MGNRPKKYNESEGCSVSLIRNFSGKVFLLLMSICLIVVFVWMFLFSEIYGAQPSQPALEKLGYKNEHKSSQWKDTLLKELPVLGHRNWIVIADSAYPAQTSPGTETVPTAANHFEVLKVVLKAVDESPHLKPIIYIDEELPYVSDTYSPGIDEFRDVLKDELKDHLVKPFPHEETIAKLDQAGKMFRILILKTNSTFPYSSVFIQLDCGYWSDEAAKAFEDNVRKGRRMKKE